MESKEFIKNKSGASGFFNLALNIVLLVLTIVLTISMVNNDVAEGYVMLFVSIMSLLWILHLIGFMIVQPNKSAVLTFFGVYSGTIKKNGFFWVNPFYGKRKLSLRARNLDVEPIKVNDKNGNPVMIGLVLVWKIADTYKACFEIESEVLQVVAKGQSNTTEIGLKGYEEFVRVQSDAALRKIAGLYAYDHIEDKDERLTLRSGGEEINEKLEEELGERLSIAGIRVVEARINYLAYASEIASVMLRRQQADAIIAAREKIVEGAVSMVELALNKLSENKVVELDDEKKATMVSNLMVVLCADEAASPVINTGTLY